MSKPRTIRIGIIGAGANTRGKHIPGFQAIPGVSVVAVCNRTRESGAAVAKEFGIPVVTEEWREIIESPDIDAICIGTFLHSCVVLDEADRPLTPVFTWLDQRGENGLTIVRTRLGDRFHEWQHP